MPISREELQREQSGEAAKPIDDMPPGAEKAVEQAEAEAQADKPS